MKKFINELKVGENLQEFIAAVKAKRKGKTKDNKDYLDLALSDKTGDIGAKIWQNSLDFCDDAQVGDIVKISGTVEEFNNISQIKVNSLQLTSNFEPADFIEQTPKDIDEMFEQLMKIIQAMKNKALKNFLTDLFNDKIEKDFSRNFKNSPGAEKVHHAYIGGLLEHVYEMAQLAKVFIKEYEKINPDILFAGIILHDIGKMKELNTKTIIYRTVEGSLLGHLLIGAIWTSELLEKQKNFPQGLKTELLHLITSHHGLLEFGSPVVPKTQEAIALHYLDNISSKVNHAYKLTQKSLETSEVFSQFSRILNTELYLSDNFDDELNEPKPKNLTLGF